MVTKRDGLLCQVVPIVAGMIGMTALSVSAADVPALTEPAPSMLSRPDPADGGATALLPPLSLQQGPDSKPSEKMARISEKGDRTAAHLSPEPVVLNASLQPSERPPERRNSAENGHPTQLPQFTVTTLTEDPLETVASDDLEIQFAAIALPELESLPPAHQQSLPPAHQPMAQVEPASGPSSSAAAPRSSASSRSPRWQFTFAPYMFVPFNVEGDATVRDFTADFSLDLGDVLSPLNFAAAGRVEGWRGNLGFIVDAAYFKLSSDESRSFSLPNCFCNIFPSEIDTEIRVRYGQFDLGLGYRFAFNTSDAANTFEMGPFVADVIVGMRIYAFDQEIDISTNIGTERNLEQSNTLVTPLVSGQVRLNLSPKLAAWMRGDMAGFGIGGTMLAAALTGGLDWMVWGNTSLLLAYRVSSLEYSTDVRGEDFELDLLIHGPYMGVVFRF